jgi:hypothetical protein
VSAWPRSSKAITTVAAHLAGLPAEGVLAVLERERLDHALALHAAEARLLHVPARGVHHEGDARDVGLRGQQVQEPVHGVGRVEQPLVHVHVEDLGAALDLLPRHLERLGVGIVGDQAPESTRAGHVGALADVHEQRVGAERDGLEPRQARPAR